MLNFHGFIQIFVSTTNHHLLSKKQTTKFKSTKVSTARNVEIPRKPGFSTAARSQENISRADYSTNVPLF